MEKKQIGTVVISIDDGSKDHYRLFQMLAQRQIPATFNIITSVIGDDKHLTVEQLREISRHPQMEIACHSHTHVNDEEDILISLQWLRENLGISLENIGFASPGSKIKREHVVGREEYWKKLGFLYIRSSKNPVPEEWHLALQKELEEKGASAYVCKRIPQLIRRFSHPFIPSVTIKNDADPENLKAFVELAAEQNVCVVLMFHRVVEKGDPYEDSPWSYDLSKTEDLLDFIEKKREEGTIRVLTTKEAYLQLQE